MKYRRMPIEAESPEEMGYGNIRCNLAESSVTDAKFGDLKIDASKLILAYGDHRGKPELRELIAENYPGINSEDVLITQGAAAALFIVSTSLLEKEDHLVVQFPNYATNIETPLAIGCAITQMEMKFGNDFAFDAGDVERAVQKNSKLISITNPHNPTGSLLDEKKLRELIGVAERKNIFLLVDETYRDLNYGIKPPLAATLSEKAISICSLSKAHGIPGIRMGWLITKNKKLQELFLAAKEQIFVSNSVLDEEAAFQYLQNCSSRVAWVTAHVHRNFSIVKEWMKDNEFLEWKEPMAGVICFPRFRKKTDTGKFYKLLFEKYSTYVGPGHWFGMSDNYMRIGFGWPSENELREGLKNISAAADLCC